MCWNDAPCRRALAVIAVGLLAAGLAPAPASCALESVGFTDVSDLDLEQLLNTVITASKREQSLADAPASVTIFGAADIERFGWLTLADLLRAVPGLYVSYDRVYEYLGVRGFSRPGDFNSRVLVLLDGHPMQEGWYGSAAIGYAAGFDLTGVRRVEVVRGPGSVLYGSSAFFAVINVVTMDAAEADGIAIDTRAGSHGAWAARGRLGARLTGPYNVVAVASRTRVDGANLSFPQFEDDYGTSLAKDADYQDAGSGFVKLTRGALGIMASYGAREKGMPTAPYDGVFGDARNRAIDRRGFIEASYARPLAAGVDIDARVYADHSSFDDYISYAGEDASTTVFRDDARNTWAGTELRLAVHQIQHSVTTFGGEFQANRFALDAYEEGGAGAVIRDHRDYTYGAFCIQNELGIGGRVNTTAGIRVERHSLFGSVTVPRAGVIVGLMPTLHAKLLYGEAFRNPNLAEAFFDDTAWIAPNPDLHREHVATREVALEKTIGRDHLLTLSYYSMTVSDLIDQDVVVIPDLVDAESGDTGERLKALNLGSVTGRGVEARYEALLRSDTRIFVGATAARTRVVTGDAESALANSPELAASAGFAQSFVDGRFSVGLTGEFVGDRMTFRDEMQEVDAHLLTNLNLRYRAENGVLVALLARNLGNASYADPIGDEHRLDRMPQDGRTVEARVGFGF